MNKALSLLGIASFVAFPILATLEWIPVHIAGYYTAASLVAMAVYGYDKGASKHQWSRIQEGYLLLISLFGGWPGALIAQQILRHKTRKTSFQLWFWLTVLMNLAALAWWIPNLR